MQIAGNKCRVCNQNIVLSSEGKFCGGCGTFAHLSCDSEAICSACGKPFTHYERPKADPFSEAILPRSLRTGNGMGPMLLWIAVLGFVVIVLFYFLEYGLKHTLDSL